VNAYLLGVEIAAAWEHYKVKTETQRRLSIGKR